MFSLVLLCFVLGTYVVWRKYGRNTGGYTLPPAYPGELPIIGHTHLIMGDGVRLWKMVKSMCEESAKNGGVIRMNIGMKLYYVITDPDDALTVANACTQKHFAYDFAKPWLGQGLITGSGEVWMRHRKLLTPAFGLPVVHSFLGVFNTQSRKLVEVLEDKLGGPFDHMVYLRRIALETFCLTGFGINTLDDQDFIEKYMDAVEQILRIMTARFQNVWLQSDIIFKLCGLQKKQANVLKILNDMSNKIIQKKKAALKNGVIIENDTPIRGSGAKYKAFLDLLMELSEDDALTDQEIREEVDTAIVTGFDTTSNLLGYIIILLGTYPEAQDKLYEEIQKVFPTDRDVCKEDLQHLVYTEAVIKESLRVITTGPTSLRYVDKPVNLNNYIMRPGSQCFLLLSGINRSAAWGEDADRFRPDRWLNPDTLPTNPNAFAGFSLGKRSCLGKTYAMISMKTTVVHFMRRYCVSADVTRLQFSMDFLLKPVSGHEITIENRFCKGG